MYAWIRKYCMSIEMTTESGDQMKTKKISAYDPVSNRTVPTRLPSSLSSSNAANQRSEARNKKLKGFHVPCPKT